MLSVRGYVVTPRCQASTLFLQALMNSGVTLPGKGFVPGSRPPPGSIPPPGSPPSPTPGSISPPGTPPGLSRADCIPGERNNPTDTTLAKTANANSQMLNRGTVLIALGPSNWKDLLRRVLDAQTFITVYPREQVRLRASTLPADGS